MVMYMTAGCAHKEEQLHKYAHKKPIEWEICELQPYEPLKCAKAEYVEELEKRAANCDHP